jgi:hypothetical protein
MVTTINLTEGGKRICTVITKFFCFFILPFAASPASGQRGEESVVLIYTPTFAGYGVAWQRPDNIVTVLHVVAGKSKILVKWKDQSSPATIKTVYKEADLALLQLQKPLGVPPLEIYQGDPPLDRPLDYWEVPDGAARVDRKETKLNAEKRAIPLRQFDNRIATAPNTFAKALCSDGQSNYPGLNTNVFKFEEKNVGKSHSGSPLTYNGKIVGLVDGGQPIGGKACVWAIPAALHFKSLPASTAVAPKQTCASEKLYGGLRRDNPLLEGNEELETLADTLAYYEDNPFVVADDANDRLTFDLQYRAPFREFYDSMFQEDQKYIQGLLEDDDSAAGGPVKLPDLFDRSLDSFQDDLTGATIVIPAQGHIRIEKSPEGNHTLVAVSDPDSKVEMTVFVEKTESKEAVEQARLWFEEFIVSDGLAWQQEESEDDDDFEDADLANDPDEPYYTKFLDRVVYGGDDEIVAELYASITVDENFLGVVIKIRNWHELTKEQRLHYYLMEACAVLTDFAYY